MAGGRNTVIFDLSEVLISGLVGVEQKLAPALGVKEEAVLPALGGEPLRELCRGNTTEDEYLAGVLKRTKWRIGSEQLKSHVRANFHWKVGGMKELALDLSARYRVCVYSDHGREWIEYITEIHPFLSQFAERVYSFEIGLTKKDPGAFEAALGRLGCTAADSVFIDDNEGNVQNARVAGLCGIRFYSHTSLRAALAGQGIA